MRVRPVRRKQVDRSFKRFSVIIVLTIAIYGGFVWGRGIGTEQPPRRPAVLKDLSRLLSANAGGMIGDADGAQDSSRVPPIDILETVLERVNRDYIDAGNNNLRLSNGALLRMFASLKDLHTSFLDAPLKKATQDALNGRFRGIGAKLAVTKTKKVLQTKPEKEEIEYLHLTVVSVMPGSPAEKAGLKSGDFITEVDGRWIIGYRDVVELQRLQSLKEEPEKQNEEFKKIEPRFKDGLMVAKALPLLLTGEGKKVNLTVERAGQKGPLRLELTTALTQVAPVEFRLVGNSVGYLRVHQFNPQATLAFRQELAEKAKGLKGLIVDLRSNPGGMRAEKETGVDGYNSALSLIGQLTPGGTIANIERKPNHKEPLIVKANAAPLNLPMAVLVDRGTANLAELVAAALRDTRKAKVIGAKTFGDSVIQYFATLKNGNGALIANAKLFTLAGADMSAGVTPDIPVSAAESGQDDVILQRALTSLGA